MNDPHVVALIYKIVHDPTVHYDNAEPIKYEADDFSVKVKDEIVCFEMKKHCASEKEAQTICNEYIQAWEVSAGLALVPSAFNLKYDDIEIMDRVPTSEASKLELRDRLKIDDGLHRIIRSYNYDHYPTPAPEIKVTPDVRSMYDRFQGYRSGKEPLASMAYFCLTVLESSVGRKERRKKVAKNYYIEQSILEEIARLSTNKGGKNARKAIGLGNGFTDQERCFLEKAIKTIILRVGEKAKSSSQSLPIISLSSI